MAGSPDGGCGTNRRNGSRHFSLYQVWLLLLMIWTRLNSLKVKRKQKFSTCKQGVSQGFASNRLF